MSKNNSILEFKNVWCKNSIFLCPREFSFCRHRYYSHFHVFVSSRFLTNAFFHFNYLLIFRTFFSDQKLSILILCTNVAFKVFHDGKRNGSRTNISFLRILSLVVFARIKIIYEIFQYPVKNRSKWMSTVCAKFFPKYYKKRSKKLSTHNRIRRKIKNPTSVFKILSKIIACCMPTKKCKIFQPTCQNYAKKFKIVKYKGVLQNIAKNYIQNDICLKHLALFGGPQRIFLSQ